MGTANIIGAYTQKIEDSNVGNSRLRKSFFIYVSPEIMKTDNEFSGDYG
jgi:hypothetical protein